MTKITATLPEGDSNGLEAISRRLIDDPREVHVVVALMDCKQTTTDNDTGAVVPTARIRHIEPIAGDDKDVAVRMLRRALERRTGKTELPFDMEQELDELLEAVDLPDIDGVDPSTGEITE